MKATKGNREYTITQAELEGYRAQGFDISDDNGNVIAYAKNKTVSYEKYVKVVNELKELKNMTTGVTAKERGQEEEKLTNIEFMTVEDLIAYAESNGINVGNATSREGILKKIRAAQGE